MTADKATGGQTVLVVFKPSNETILISPDELKIPTAGDASLKRHPK